MEWSCINIISNFVSGNQIIQRTVQTVRTDLTRTGLQTDVVEDIVEESQGFKIISRALIPFIRPRVINFEGELVSYLIQEFMYSLTNKMLMFCNPFQVIIQVILQLLLVVL